MARIILLAMLCGAAGLFAADKPVELGKIDWLRDHAEAVKQAKASGKPIMILFQEVPG